MGLLVQFERSPEVWDCVQLPDGSHARLIAVEDDVVRGEHYVRPGVTLNFWTTRVCWILLRGGAVPRRMALSRESAR